MAEVEEGFVMGAQNLDNIRADHDGLCGCAGCRADRNRLYNQPEERPMAEVEEVANVSEKAEHTPGPKATKADTRYPLAALPHPEDCPCALCAHAKTGA